MLKIRLQGTEEEIKKGVESLKNIYKELDVSKPYKNRNSEYYRVYLNVELEEK